MRVIYIANGQVGMNHSQEVFRRRKSREISRSQGLQKETVTNTKNKEVTLGRCLISNSLDEQSNGETTMKEHERRREQK